MEGHTAAAVLPSARVEWAVATRGTQERGPDADGFECARAGAAGSVISATLGQISLTARVAAAAASTSDGQRAGGGTCEKEPKLHHFISTSVDLGRSRTNLGQSRTISADLGGSGRIWADLGGGLILPDLG